MTKKDIAKNAVLSLKKEYPKALCSLQYENPFHLLVATRLAAQCTDNRVNMVTPKLFEHFPTPYEFANSTAEEVEEYIKSCGLYKTKAKDIVACSKMIAEKFDGKVPKTLDELITLPGIGRKTANLIMGDVYNTPGAVVVDTHCIRITSRLGLHSETDMKKIEFILRDLLPEDESSDFCHRLVMHKSDRSHVVL